MNEKEEKKDVILEKWYLLDENWKHLRFKSKGNDLKTLKRVIENTEILVNGIRLIPKKDAIDKFPRAGDKLFDAYGDPIWDEDDYEIEVLTNGDYEVIDKRKKDKDKRSMSKTNLERTEKALEKKHKE